MMSIILGLFNNTLSRSEVGRVSSVAIATSYGLDGPGIETRWERDFSPHVQTSPGAHPPSCTEGTGRLSGG